MAANIPLATFVTQRDNLLTAYTTVSTSVTKTYSLGDRTFGYEDRDKILDEIMRLNKLITLMDSTIDARGRNRADLRVWG